LACWNSSRGFHGGEKLIVEQDFFACRLASDSYPPSASQPLTSRSSER